MNANYWSFEFKRDFALWLIKLNDTHYQDPYREILKALDYILYLGTVTKLLYPTDPKTDIREISASIVKANKLNSIIELHLPFSTILDVYDTKGNIIPLQFNPINVKDNLILINHPKLQDYNLNFYPTPIAIGTSCSGDLHSNYITIAIYYDIFFPYVLCEWEYKRKFDDNDIIPKSKKLVDIGCENNFLSYLNGSRLNFMISKLKEYADEHNMIINFDSSKPIYHEWLTLEGIKLQ